MRKDKVMKEGKREQYSSGDVFRAIYVVDNILE